jgi:hypothetical protein
LFKSEAGWSSSREILATVIAFFGGMGGLASTLVWSDILSALNRSRPADDQIPFAITTRSDVRWLLKNFQFDRWRFLKDFHHEFPQSRLYYWYLASFGWMALCFVTCAALIFIR